MESMVFYGKECALQDLGGGVMRRVIAHRPEMMMVEVHFEVDSIGSKHTHPHVQCTYVKEGAFEFDIEGEKRMVKAGDSLAIAPDAVHGVTCLEKGMLLDVFTPMREDFLNK